jgi:hypothetical protein
VKKLLLALLLRTLLFAQPPRPKMPKPMVIEKPVYVDTIQGDGVRVFDGNRLLVIRHPIYVDLDSGWRSNNLHQYFLTFNIGADKCNFDVSPNLRKVLNQNQRIKLHESLLDAQWEFCVKVRSVLKTLP